MNIRIGQGIDAHRFTSSKKNIVLGGVTIPFEMGLEGHSDADALIHAICDALLGASALGDIGKHFSDQDPAFKNKESTFFLSNVFQKISAHGFKIANVDSTVMCEKPMLAPFIEAMQAHISKTLQLEKNQVSIKATRPEKMGALGRGEGLIVFATALLYK